MEETKYDRNRYYRMSFSGAFNDNNEIVFDVPPLQANAFTSPTISCLGKIRRVFWGTKLDAPDLNYGSWGLNGFSTNVFNGDAGIMMLTNIPTSNQYLIASSTANAGTTANTGGRMGCVLKSNTAMLYDTKNFRAEKAPSTTQSYEDLSDIKTSGIICGNPFGQKLVLIFRGTEPMSATSNRNLEPVFFDSNVSFYKSQVGAMVTCEMEFLILEER